VIHIQFREDLRVKGGKLVTGGRTGTEVHAATYLRAGIIILDRALTRRPVELRRIFLHELFHFAWWKLGNPKRHAWEQILKNEFSRRARGELGWSAELRKNLIGEADIRLRTRAWREYCCESFCDSGASHLGKALIHEEFTLAPRFRRIRHEWLSDIIQSEDDLVRIVNPEHRWSGFVWADGMPGLRPLPHSKRAVREVR
jgi:hypothetical protein